MNRNWNILCWNVRGINSEDKWLAIRNKIEESSCVVFCLQESKRQNFDHSNIKKSAPKRFDSFFFFPPSVGPSGGILVCWVGSLFSYRTLHVQRVIVSVQFTSLHSAETWCLSSVYGSCTEPHRIEFIEWLHDLNIPDDAGWIFLGDFT